MRHRIFLVVLFLLGGLCTAAIVTLAKMFPMIQSVQTVVSWQYAFLAIVIVIGLLSLLRKFRQRVLWEILFTITLFLGVWYALLLVLPIWAALVLSSFLTIAFIFVRNVFVHDAFYLLGAAGVAINFAGWLPADVLIAVLVAFTLYDMVIGPPGGPIQSFASDLVRKGIVPGIIVPARLADLFVGTDTAVKGSSFLLGAGDLILPMTLVAKASFAGIVPSAIVLSGLVAGAFVLGRSEDSHPHAALPALAAGTALPFIVLRFLMMV